MSWAASKQKLQAKLPLPLWQSPLAGTQFFQHHFQEGRYLTHGCQHCDSLMPCWQNWSGPLTNMSESWASQTKENIEILREALSPCWSFVLKAIWHPQNLHFTGQVLMYEQLDRAKSSDIMGILATPLPPPEIWSSICIYFKPHIWGKTYEQECLYGNKGQPSFEWWLNRGKPPNMIKKRGMEMIHMMLQINQPVFHVQCNVCSWWTYLFQSPFHQKAIILNSPGKKHVVVWSIIIYGCFQK